MVMNKEILGRREHLGLASAMSKATLLAAVFVILAQAVRLVEVSDLRERLAKVLLPLAASQLVVLDPAVKQAKFLPPPAANQGVELLPAANQGVELLPAANQAVELPLAETRVVGHLLAEARKAR